MADRGGWDFTASVLRVIRRIPRGRVAMYAAVAAAVGSPRAVRAVGTALGKNQHPGVRCPCHRVVRSDGKLGGYALGLRRKIALLRREGVLVVEGQVQPRGWYVWKGKSKNEKGKYARQH